MKKRVLSLLLALVLGLSVFTAAPFGVSAEEIETDGAVSASELSADGADIEPDKTDNELADTGADSELAETGAESGTTGDCTWEVSGSSSSNRSLYIRGSGAMADYDTALVPWQDYSIKWVYISPEVTRIGSYAFYGFSSITYAALEQDEENGSNLKSIGNNAFGGCGISSIEIPGSVTEIGSSAFFGCSSLSTVTFDDPAVAIGDKAFCNCGNLNKVTVPSSVKSIGNLAFGYVYSSGSYGKRVNFTMYGDIGSEAERYANANGFEFISSSGSAENYSWDISDGVLTISGSGAMDDFSQTNAPWRGFKYDKVIIENGVTRIGSNAFYNLTDIKSISIPASVTNIGEKAFYGCSNLTELHLEDLGAWCAVEFADSTSIPFAYTYSYVNNYLYLNDELITDLVIPDSVTSIGARVFCNCNNLKSVTVSDSVISIGEYAFFECSYLTRADLSGNVEEIGDHAFQYCSNLINVDFSDSLTTIGERAFYYCNSLTYADLSGNVTEIGDEAFAYCSSLTNVDFSDSLSTIGYSAFSSCSALAVLNLPSSVTTIGSYAFADCKKISYVKLPEFLSSLGASVFSSCSSITKVTIPDYTESIGDYAFLGCSALDSVTIPDSVKTIGKYAFGYYSNSSSYSGYYKVSGFTIYGNAGSAAQKYAKDYNLTFLQTNGTTGDCTWTVSDNVLTVSGSGNMGSYSSSPWANYNIEKVIIKKGVTSIGKYSFTDCTSINDVTIPDTVTTIGEAAFKGCTSLSGVIIPESVTSIGASAFLGCTMDNITLPASVSSIGTHALGYHYSSYSYQKRQGFMVYVVLGSAAEDYALENSFRFAAPPRGTTGDCTWSINGDLLTISGSGSMANYDSETAPWASYKIGRVIIESGVKNIGSYAFKNCTSLTSITIPMTVRTIGASAFTGCTNLVNVYIFNISSWCTTVFKDKESSPFFASTESYEKKLYVKGEPITHLEIPETVTFINSYAFYRCTPIKSVSIPKTVKSISGYVFAGSGITSVVLPDSLTKISKHLFEDSALKSIVIPDSVTEIERYAFCNTPLTSIIIPDSVTSMGEYLFSGCSSLTDVTVPDSVTSIGNYAFDRCSSLSNLTLPDSLKSIGSYAFNNCGLTEISIPDSVTNIGEGAFSVCKNLGSIPDLGSVTSISDKMFSNCSGLTYISIPDTATSIGKEAFTGCSNLSVAEVPSSVTSIGNNAFYYNTALCCERDSAAEKYAIKNSMKLFAKEKDKSGFYYKITNSGNCEVTGYRGYTSDLVIPPVMNGYTVKSIAADAFRSSSITSVKIPSTVVSVGSYAFFNSGLTSVTIPSSVRYIGDYAFGYVEVWISSYYGYISGKKSGFVIYGQSGSAAQTYAYYFDIDFQTVTETAASVTCEVTSYLSDTDAIKLTLLKSDGSTFAQNSNLMGKSVSYTFIDVPDGQYTLRAEKNNHVTREETLIVASDDVSKSVKLCPLGDVNNDGKTTQTDYVTAISYVRKTKDLNDYQIKCGDVFGSGDGKLTAQDANRIVQHTRKVKLLY